MLKTESRQGTLPGAPSPGKFSLPNLQVLVMLGAILVIALFFTWTTDGAWLSPRNVSNLLRQTAITGILAVGMVFVIISAEIDLSVGSMMGLLGGAAAIFDVWLGWPLPLTIAVTLLMGLLLGTWSGWWVAKCRRLSLRWLACWRSAAFWWGSPTAPRLRRPRQPCRRSGRAIFQTALASVSASPVWRCLCCGSGGCGCAVSSSD